MAALSFKLGSCEGTAELYRLLLENFSIVAITDKNGVIIDVNKKFVDVTGFSRDEILGSTHKIVNSGYHNKDFWKKMWGQISSGKSFRATIKNRTKSGNHYWVDTMIYPVCGDNKEPEFYISVRNLVTETVERRIKEKNRNKELHQIVSKTRGLVHDLANSLMIVHAGSSRDEMTEKTIQSVRRAADTSVDLTKSIRKSLKDYEKIASAYSEGISFLENLLNDCDLLYANRGVFFHLEYELDTFGWNIPFQEFDRILHNLIKNSVEAMTLSDQKNIVLKVEAKKDNPKLSIYDTGRGIPEKNREQIFQRGFSTKAQSTNDGLGLFNIRETLNSYGFEIILNESMTGTIFEIIWESEF